MYAATKSLGVRCVLAAAALFGLTEPGQAQCKGGPGGANFGMSQRLSLQQQQQQFGFSQQQFAFQIPLQQQQLLQQQQFLLQLQQQQVYQTWLQQQPSAGLTAKQQTALLTALEKQRTINAKLIAQEEKRTM